MCLGIPGKVVDVYREHDLLMGKVDFGGVLKRVCLEYVPQIAVGEYALVHVGFALTRLPPFPYGAAGRCGSACPCPRGCPRSVVRPSR